MRGEVVSKALVVFFGLFVVAATAEIFHYSVTPTYRLSWSVNEPQETITISVEVDAACWVGVGWHCAESSCNSSITKMPEADFAIALFNDDGTLKEVIDGVASKEKNGFTMPPSDITMNGTNDFFNVSGYQSKLTPRTTFTFSRKFATKDFNDHKWLNATTRFIWAHGDLTSENPNTFAFHKENAGPYQLNLFSATQNSQADDTDDFVEMLHHYHGALMVFGFAFCMPVGIFIARHLKSHKWWFSTHIVMQVIGTMSVFTAFGLMIWAKIVSDMPQFESVHARFGLTTLIVVFLNVIMGIVADRKFDPNRIRTPFFPDKVHWWLGRIIYGLSMTTVVLGMFRDEIPMPVIVVFFIAIGVQLSLYFFVDIKKWLAGDLDYEYLNNENESLLTGTRPPVNYRK